jgi:AraC-like DNA-binding protein
MQHGTVKRSPALLCQAEQLYNLGLTTYDVARQLGISQPTAVRWLRGKTRPHSALRSRVSTETVLMLRNKGLTWRQVAQQSGLSASGAHARYRAWVASQASDQ